MYLLNMVQLKLIKFFLFAQEPFHLSKPSDLLPELQGRLPIRVQLNPLKKEQFKKILTDTDNSLTKQYIALIKTEGVRLSF